jgi:hypothetical protein
VKNISRWFAEPSEIWDESDTEEKRRLLFNVLTNAAGTRVCSDDVIRIFMDWIRIYSEVHFAIMREVYKTPGSTRYDIWVDLYEEETSREDSSQADLYRYIIRELNTGGVIRQPRDTNAAGQFLRKRPHRTRKGGAPGTMESTFEDTKPYVLTELGKEFVHYTMNEVIDRIAAESGHRNNSHCDCLPLLKPNSYDGIEFKLPGWRRASLRSPDGALC